MKVFISHSSADKKFVRTLKQDLKENDIDTWLDEDQLDLGDSLQDRLNESLEEMSHFLIVLSKAELESDWVRLELDKAFKQKNSNLLQKIIPIKYQPCTLPKELSDLLYEDLSLEVRTTDGHHVKFTGTRYEEFVTRLCRAIRNSEKSLTPTDKSSIKKEVAISLSSEAPPISQNIVHAGYVIIGYRSAESREKYSSKILEAAKLSISKSEVKPVLLPPLLKHVFSDLKVGDTLLFSKNFLGDVAGHFGGFRRDDMGMTIDYRIRKGLGLKKGNRYNVIIDVKERRFTFMSR